MGERGVEHYSGNLAGVSDRHVATGTERAEVDVVAEGFGRLDRRGDMRPGMAFDERFDGELEQQHDTEL